MPHPFLFFAALYFALAYAPEASARSTAACFTKEETRKMVLVREAFSKEAAACLNNYWNSHAKFFNQNRYSKYYGNRNKALNTADRRALIILNVLWPDLLITKEQQAFINDFYRDKQRDSKGALPAPGLTDLEKWMEKSRPALFEGYKARKPGLRLEERAAEEKGNVAIANANLKPNSGPLLQNISCIDMTRRCLRAGFEKVGMLDTFRKIDTTVIKKDLSGVELQKALIDLGWKSYYWNPDTSQNDASDREDQELAPPTSANAWQGVWGGHAFRWSRNCNLDGSKKFPEKSGGVLCSREYSIGKESPVPIDDKELLINFGTNPPAAFLSVPFFIGSAHAGYHMFAGFEGRMIEAHSSRSLRSTDNLEVSRFNPLNQGNGGGPRWTRHEKYRSGVIVIPPGFLENGPLRFHDPQMDGECVDLHPPKNRPLLPSKF